MKTAFSHQEQAEECCNAFASALLSSKLVIRLQYKTQPQSCGITVELPSLATTDDTFSVRLQSGCIITQNHRFLRQCYGDSITTSAQITEPTFTMHLPSSNAPPAAGVGTYLRQSTRKCRWPTSLLSQCLIETQFFILNFTLFHSDQC